MHFRVERASCHCYFATVAAVGPSGRMQASRLDPAAVHPRGGEGHPGRARERLPGRFPDGRLPRAPEGRQYHDVHSSEMAFKIAGSLAYQHAYGHIRGEACEPVNVSNSGKVGVPPWYSSRLRARDARQGPG
jgi:hypothetical protein